MSGRHTINKCCTLVSCNINFYCTLKNDIALGKSISHVQLNGHPCIHAQETGWQSVVRSYIMPRLPSHLAQEMLAP